MSKRRREIAARGWVWSWLIDVGPHGHGFEWGPRGQLDLLREGIAQQTEACPSFPSEARAAALELLNEMEPELVRKAIQVLSVIATEEDTSHIENLLRHPNPSVRKDARACLFEIGGPVKSAQPALAADGAARRR